MTNPSTRNEWLERASTLELDGRPFIGGRRHGAKTDSTFNLVNVTTGENLATLPDCGTEDVDAAVAAARRAFETGLWAKMAPSERSQILKRFGDLVAKCGETLGLLDTLQMGMPIALSTAIAPAGGGILRDFAELAEHHTNLILPSAATALITQIRRPKGVVAAITPWNFPIHVALSKVAPALAAGNSVILKPSEIAPLACLMLADLATEAGLPDGVFNVLPGLGATTGRLLALHKDVDCLTFTGSTATGLRLLEYAAQSNMKPLLLECGGKSPQIVLDDVGDLDGLAQVLFDGFTWNAGQVCTNGSRILIAEALYDRLTARLIEKVNAAMTGHALEPSIGIGPLAGTLQHQRVSAFLEGVEPSDHLLAQGTISKSVPFEVAPHLFEAGDPNSRLTQSEVFGPVASVMRFKDEAHAIALANGTRYGLSANIWTKDVAAAHRIVQDLRAGFVSINRVPQPAPAGARFYSGEPFGMSGYGADGGLAGLLSYTRLQSVNYHFA